jgi:glucose/arabinose dehydrogenase
LNYLLRSLTVVAALVACSPAFASDPAEEVASAPAAAAPTVAPATPATPATEAPKPAATATASNATAKNEPTKVPAGYKVKVVDGETRFCRKDVPLGSRFPTEVCMTQAQYQEQERNRDSMRNEIQDRQKSYSINY